MGDGDERRMRRRIANEGLSLRKYEMSYETTPLSGPGWVGDPWVIFFWVCAERI